MTILTHKQTLTFTEPGTWNDNLNRYEGSGKTITIAPTPGPKEVPEWVRYSETFKLASPAGLVREIAIIPQPGDAPLPGIPMPAGYQLAEASASEARPTPPTLDVVMKAGYSKKVAESIVAKEAAKAAAGYPPYGNTPEPAPEAQMSAPVAEPAADVPAPPVMTPKV